MKRMLSLFLALVMAVGIFCSVPFTQSPLKLTADAASKSDLEFELEDWDEESYYVSDCKKSASGSLTIPATYNGSPVTSIGEFAFGDCTGLTSVTIPDSVTSIYWLAFFGCTDLTSVTIPDSVIRIDSYAFEGCSNLTIYGNTYSYAEEYAKKFDIPFVSTGVASLLRYELDFNEDSYYVAGCNTAVKGAMEIPSEYKGLPVAYIGESAFSDCTGLTSVTIPDSVMEISGYAFSDCTGLTSVTIPDSVIRIDSDAFEGCNNLTIYGNTYSYAEEYAKKFDIPFVSTGVADLFRYKLNDDKKSYSVVGCSSTVKGAMEIPSEYKGLPVTDIGEYAFEGCSGVTSVTIPNSVTEIGYSAFSDCSSLKSVTIPDSVNYIDSEAFYGCDNLTIYGITYSRAEEYATDNDIPFVSTGVGTPLRYELNDDKKSYSVVGCSTVVKDAMEIPSEYKGLPVTCIGEEAFNYCTRLTSITIPNSVTSIGNDAFNGCEGLTSITIPNSVTSIGSYAFNGCEGLTSITIPNSVTSIGYGTFWRCESLTSVTIPNSVISIGECAFQYCFGLTSVTISNGVTSIGDSAFYCCTNLTSITIPNSVTSIGSDAFGDCSKLTAINVSDNNKNYASVDGVLFNKNKTELIVYPVGKTNKSYSVPSTVKTIGGGAFGCCTGLTSVTIPNSVTNIENSAFWGCTGLTSITIPNSVTNIGSNAFYETGYYNKSSNWEKGVLYVDNHLVDTNEDLPYSYTIKNGTKTIAGHAFAYSELTSVTIPNSVVTIGESAFESCSSLTSVMIPESVTSIGYGAFGYCESLTSVMIPESVTSIGDDAFSYCGYDYEYDSYNFAIYGKTNSAAHIYAKENDIKFVDSTKPGTPKLNSVSNSASGVIVKWSKVTGADSYTVYRKSGGSGWKSVKSGLTGTSYTDTTAKSGTKYTYTVCSFNKSVKGGYDNTGKTVLFLSAPKLSSVANSTSGVTIKWSKVTGAKEYYVYRKSGNSGWKKIGTSTGTSYTDKTAKSGTSYTYTVRAYNGKTSSAYNTKGLTIKFLATPKLSSVANSTSGVTVKWGKVTGAKEYYVYRKSGNSGWKKIGTSTGTSYTDKTAKSGTTYTYTVRACNGKTASYYNTNGISIKFLATPKLSSVSSAKSGVTLKWGKVTGASGYYVYRKTGNGGWKKIATVKGNSKVSYLDKSAKKGTTYTYTVRAYNGKTASAYNTKGLKIKDKY